MNQDKAVFVRVSITFFERIDIKLLSKLFFTFDIYLKSIQKCRLNLKSIVSNELVIKDLLKRIFLSYIKSRESIDKHQDRILFERKSTFFSNKNKYKI